MIIIQQTLVSDDILDEKFACNLQACKGACCVEGDEGAFVEPEERKMLEIWTIKDWVKFVAKSLSPYEFCFVRK
ncbi:MAG TPA: DUF3109 family protein [Chitinophagales bacterium]|nr:DUF3109 family protein [Chitinophagales bacterium]